MANAGCGGVTMRPRKAWSDGGGPSLGPDAEVPRDDVWGPETSHLNGHSGVWRGRVRREPKCSVEGDRPTPPCHAARGRGASGRGSH